MPFNLTNAPAPFQALMNDVLKPLLRRFVLVFFDDILIYSSTWVEHMQHVKAVFQRLREHMLFAKRSKCFFGAESVGVPRPHYISSRCCHGSGEGRGRGCLATSAYAARTSGFPRPYGILPQIHYELRRGCCPSDGSAQGHSILLE